MRRLISESLAACAFFLGVGVTSSVAQTARLEGRLDEATRAAIEHLADSARTVQLPVEPLIAKALEGAAKRASGERIVAAVRGLVVSLGAARSALGPGASEADLAAGADALRAGAPAGVLSRLRADRAGESVALPLAILADLISRGVPADTASTAVLLLASRGAGDAEFTALEQGVAQDIRGGAQPAWAAANRARRGPPPGLPGVPHGNGKGPPKDNPSPSH